MLMNLLFSTDFLFSVIRVSTPLVFAALGALVSDKGGIVNIGLEGIMLTAALGGVLGSAYSNSATAGLLVAVFSGLVFVLILGWFTLHLKTDIILGGIALNLFASGGTIFVLHAFTGDKGNSASLASKTLPDITLPIIHKIPVIGEILSGHNLLTYICILSIFGVWFFMKHTKRGTWIRAVGENPQAAESVGINVKKIQMQALLLSGLFASLGGAFPLNGICIMVFQGYVCRKRMDCFGGRSDGRRTGMGNGSFFSVFWHYRSSCQYIANHKSSS